MPDNSKIDFFLYKYIMISLSKFVSYALDANASDFQEFALFSKSFIQIYRKILLDLIAQSNRLLSNKGIALITVRGTLFARICNEYEYSSTMINEVRKIFVQNEDDREELAKKLFEYFHETYLKITELYDAIQKIFTSKHNDNPYTVKLMVADWISMH